MYLLYAQFRAQLQAREQHAKQTTGDSMMFVINKGVLLYTFCLRLTNRN